MFDHTKEFLWEALGLTKEEYTSILKEVKTLIRKSLACNRKSKVVEEIYTYLQEGDTRRNLIVGLMVGRFISFIHFLDKGLFELADIETPFGEALSQLIKQVKEE